MKTIPFLIAVVMSAAPVLADHVSLHIQWMGVIDNGEGDDWPHGPHGNFHYEVFDAGNRPLIHGILYGPSKNEWLDRDEKFYPAFMIHKWAAGEKKVRVKIWESDPGPFRRHDTVFDAWINRSDTTGRVRTWWYDTAPADAMRNVRRRAPAWIGNLAGGIPMNAKTYVKFVTRTIPAGTTYRWVHVGYGDIPHHDNPPAGGRTSSGMPDPKRCGVATLGLGAVCPNDDPAKCHYKNVSALEVIGGRGKHPGPVYECIGPSRACTYKWVPRGRGDIGHHDLGSPSAGRTPDPARCNAQTLGLGAVSPDDDPTKCHYKDVPAAQVINGGGRHPGVVYECVCELG